jgi:hypothetical protein
MNLPSAYYIFQTLRLEEKSHSLSDHIKELEGQLDLRDYYDIKRPTVVFFFKRSLTKQLRVKRYDIMSENQHESIVKLLVNNNTQMLQ